jgi:hypothetical protein
MKKALLLLIPAGVAALIARQWQDISRFIKIKQISSGQGHPENVPAHGRISYPQQPTLGGDTQIASGNTQTPGSDPGTPSGQTEPVTGDTEGGA